MPLPSRSSRGTALAILIAALVPALAAAQKAVPEARPLEGPIQGDLIRLGAPVCVLGVTTSQSTINYLSPPRDRYYTAIRASDCIACSPTDAIGVKFAHFTLSFQAQCTVDVLISIVDADTVAGCLVPDTNAVVCLPRAVQVEPTGSGTFDLAAAAASGCRFSGDAFLCVEFSGFGPECANPNQKPVLVISGQCDVCGSYNHFPSGTPSGWGGGDVCPSISGRPTMYVEGDVCVTALKRSSWGSLKILYR